MCTWLRTCLLTLNTVGKHFSRRHFDFFFLYFSQQTRSDNGHNLHNMLNPVFWENKENKMSPTELAQRVVKFNPL